MTLSTVLLIGVAAFLAGALNAVAGGGSLISFPALLAAGISPVTASMTNTVALCPGYLGGLVTQRADLIGQYRRLLIVIPASIIGGVAGSLLLLVSDDQNFDQAVPFLLLLATGLTAVQEKMRVWLRQNKRSRELKLAASLLVALVSVYGGYFGAGMGVMIFATLGILLGGGLLQLNALKQVCTLTVNVAAAISFIFTTDQIAWSVVLIMAVASLIGGMIGGRFVRHLPSSALRNTIVALGLAISVLYFIKNIVL